MRPASAYRGKVIVITFKYIKREKAFTTIFVLVYERFIIFFFSYHISKRREL